MRNKVITFNELINIEIKDNAVIYGLKIKRKEAKKIKTRDILYITYDIIDGTDKLKNIIMLKGNDKILLIHKTNGNAAIVSSKFEVLMHEDVGIIYCIERDNGNAKALNSLLLPYSTNKNKNNIMNKTIEILLVTCLIFLTINVLKDNMFIGVLYILFVITGLIIICKNMNKKYK